MLRKLSHLLRGKACNVITLCLLYSAWTFCSYTFREMCAQTCREILWETPPSVTAEMILEHVRKEVILPAQQHPPQPLSRDETYNPSWMSDEWKQTNIGIMSYLDYIGPGTFVEVGSGDGHFHSFSKLLEDNLNWTGLLVEPRREAVLELRQHRKAAIAPVCASIDVNKQAYLWRPGKPGENNEFADGLLQKYNDDKATMLPYVLTEDIDDGHTTLVQCLSLSTLIRAFLPPKHFILDALILNTGGGEWEMLMDMEPSTTFIMMFVRYNHLLTDFMMVKDVCQKFKMTVIKQNFTKHFLFLSNKAFPIQ